MNRDHAARSAAVCRHLLASVLPLLVCVTATGQTSPYVIGASQSYAQDSNVVRLADGASLPASVVSKADRISTTTLLGSFDQPVGRQRLSASANLRDNRYRENGLYDNQGFALTGALDWATIERVSGNLNLSSNRTLASFDRANGNNAPNVVKNIERTDQLSATVRAGVLTRLTLEAGFSHQKQRFSESGSRLQQSVTSLGLRHQLSGGLTVGAGLRLTRGSYPDDGDDFKGRDVDLNATWTPNSISSVVARLSLGKTDHSLAAAQDFSGATGALSWDWRPSAKLALSTQFNRSTGNESSFARIGGPASALNAQADNSRLTTTWSVNMGYDLSAKVRLDANVSRAARTLTNAISINAAQPSSATDGDRLQRLRLGLRYVPTRSVELSCSLGREARSADNSTLTYAYHANTAGCSAQLALQP